MIPPGFTGTCVDFFLAHPEVAMTFTRAVTEGAEGIQWPLPLKAASIPLPKGSGLSSGTGASLPARRLW